MGSLLLRLEPILGATVEVRSIENGGEVRKKRLRRLKFGDLGILRF